jgi:hypothetical protein
MLSIARRAATAYLNITSERSRVLPYDFHLAGSLASPGRSIARIVPSMPLQGPQKGLK